MSVASDASDALAICETAFRPGIRFVPVKTTEQQDIKALWNRRQLTVEQRTALANQLRSLLAEYGFTIPVGILRLQQQLLELSEDASNSLTSSGGKQRLSSVTKNGNRGLGTLIIHGARPVMRCVKHRDDSLSRWLRITVKEIGSCHFHRTVFKLPSLISFGQRRLYFPH